MKSHLTNLRTRPVLVLPLITVLFLFSSPAALATTSSSTSFNPLTATSLIGSGPTAARTPASAGTPGKSSGGYTFVTNLADGAVDILNSTGGYVTEIEDGGCSGYGATYVPATGLVWVFDYSCNTVYVISPKTMSVVTSFGCDGCIFGAYVASNTMVYVSQFGYGEVLPINAKTYSEGSEISVCSYYPEYIATASNGMVYVPAREGCYSIINPAKKNAVTNVSLGTYPNGVACATTGKAATCWITDEDNANVYEVSGSKLIATITGCSDCYWGDAYNQADKTVYVVSLNSEVYPIKGDTLGSAILILSAADADCLGAAKTIVVPVTGSGSPGYAQGISVKNKVVWTTELGPESYDPESCAGT